MRIVVSLMLALAIPGYVCLHAARTESVPDLPQLNVEHFLPAVREQVQQAYTAARANPKDADASGRLGMVLDAYEQFDAAATCYRRAHLLDPASFRWRFYLGWVQASQGLYSDAAQTLDGALRVQADYVPAQLKRAESLLAIGRWDEGRDLYQAIVSAHPESAEAHYGLGRVSAHQREWPAAVTAYLKSCDLFPSYGAAHYSLALAYRNLGREADSRQQFDLYGLNRMSVPPSDDPLRRAVAALNVGSVAHIRRGADLEQAGRITEAIAEQAEALRVDPAAVQAHINLISLYRPAGPIRSGSGPLSGGAGARSAPGRCSLQLRGSPFETGPASGGRKSLSGNPANQPVSAEAHNNLGLLYEQQERVQEAYQQFTAVIESRPNDRAAHFHIGRILANQERYDDAIQHLRKTLVPEDDSTPRYLYALGATYARAGDLSDALACTREARAQAMARGQAQLLVSIEKDLQILEQAAANAHKP